MSMGLPDNKIEGSIRLSLGDMTTQEDIDRFKVKFETIYKEIKELLKVNGVDRLLVRYGELTLKGTNRKKFVNALKITSLSLYKL